MRSTSVSCISEGWHIGATYAARCWCSRAVIGSHRRPADGCCKVACGASGLDAGAVDCSSAAAGSAAAGGSEPASVSRIWGPWGNAVRRKPTGFPRAGTGWHCQRLSPRNAANEWPANEWQRPFHHDDVPAQPRSCCHTCSCATCSCPTCGRTCTQQWVQHSTQLPSVGPTWQLE